MKEYYHITGMTCSACSSHVEKSVRKLQGVEKASVNLLTESMEISYDEAVLSSEKIIAAVKNAGYGAALKQKEGQKAAPKGRYDREKQADEERKNIRWRLGISVGFLLPLMYVAMHHMLAEWFGLPVPEMMTRAFGGNANAMNFALTQFLLVLPILYVNRKFFSVGFKALFHRIPNMDTLIAVGSGAAMVYGVFAMYRISLGLGHGDMALVEHYAHDLYFESAGTILTLITVGKYLEGRSKGKTGEAITKLMRLAPKTAILLTEDGVEKEIPTELLKQGDIFLLKPGSFVPVDGTVLEGSSSIDEAAITGESVPVEKQTGDKVVSATMNKAGFLKCRADRVGEDTTLSQIIRLVEEAGAGKAPIARLADRVAGIFVPVVMLISLITLLVWLFTGAETEFAISSAIAVLVISCPCALGLATPVAIMVGTGVGANHGILIKSGDALQLAGETDTVVLDKTGTLTEGRLKVMQIKPVKPAMTEEQLLVLAAALESRSEHPLAEAVTAKAEGSSLLNTVSVEEFMAVFGRGIEGRLSASWLDEGRYYVGNRAYLEEKGVRLTRQWENAVNAMADEGQTPLLVSDGKGLLGIIGVADSLKESSVRAVAAWRSMGIRVLMLTGDNRRTAESVKKKLGLSEVISEVLPQDKERKISELKQAGHKVAMVGDGINDAPALAAADVGIAIGAGTDIAIDSADIVLMKSDLCDAVTAMRLSRRVIRNIRQNLFWAFFYNAIGIPLAAGVWYPLAGIRLSPMFGAAAMSMSSLFVVGNALRLRSFKSGIQPAMSDKATAVLENVQEKKREKVKEEKKERKTVMKKVITIEGMMCAHCTGRVQKALETLESVEKADMSLEDKTATVELTAAVTDEELVKAVTDAGYEVTDIR